MYRLQLPDIDHVTTPVKECSSVPAMIMLCACRGILCTCGIQHPYYSPVPDLVAPAVIITSGGDPTAGNTYILVCRVSVVEGLVVDLDVVWLDSNGMTVSGLDVTVGRPNIEGSVVTRNLTFSPLHTSHGGEYTCRASISVSKISIENLSNSSSTCITVQSMLICYQIRFSRDLHVLILVLLYTQFLHQPSPSHQTALVFSILALCSPSPAPFN